MVVELALRSVRVIPLALALLLAPLAGAGGEVLSTFSNGSSDFQVLFPPGGGYDSSASVVLPKNITILNASLDFSAEGGETVLKGLYLDFQQPNGSRAWAGTLASVPPSDPPSDLESTNITLVPGIKKSDDVRHTTSILRNAPYHLFEFRAGAVAVKAFSLTWEGIGFSDPQAGFGHDEAHLYLWSDLSGSWAFMGSAGFGEVPTEETITASVPSNASDYIDDEGFINAVVFPEQLDSNRIETDHVKLVYDAPAKFALSNISLDLGGDGSIEWSHPGELVGRASFSGDAFASALQSLVDRSPVDPVTVVLKLHADLSALAPVSLGLTLSNLRVEHEMKDMPPFLWKEVPALSVEEDGQAIGVLDLRDHFGDDNGVEGLSFGLDWLSEPGRVRARFDGTLLDLFANSTDWNGEIRARLNATDARGQGTPSNEFTVRVTPVNDPPRLERAGELTAVQGQTFRHAFCATDMDGDALEFSTNSTLFDIDAASGLVSFVPKNQDVGKHHFSVTVRDPSDAGDSAGFVLDVVNQNDPPVLDEVEDQFLTEDVPFSMMLRASDPDAELGLDSLTFGDDTALFDVSADGRISFTPANQDVGSHRVTVWAADSGGLKDEGRFAIMIVNVNDPPVVEKLRDRTVLEDSLVSFRVNASDPDAGDALAFSSESALFTVTRDGWVNFSAPQSNVGSWAARISVTDGAGATDFTSFTITVADVNDPPANVMILSPLPFTRFISRATISFSASAVDEDGDELDYAWWADGELIGEGQVLKARLRRGTHDVWVNATDGELTSRSPSVTITIHEPPPPDGIIWPGWGLIPLAAVLAAAAGAILLARKRRGRGR